MLPAESLDNKIKEFWPKSGPSTQEVKKYIKKYSKEKIVIKCGGRVLLDPYLFNNFINDITILKKLYKNMKIYNFTTNCISSYIFVISILCECYLFITFIKIKTLG